MRIAVVGSGISGLVAAHVLSREHQVVVFEADNYIGGHTNTIAVDVDGTTQHVDTGDPQRSRLHRLGGRKMWLDSRLSCP